MAAGQRHRVTRPAVVAQFTRFWQVDIQQELALSVLCERQIEESLRRCNRLGQRGPAQQHQHHTNQFHFETQWITQGDVTLTVDLDSRAEGSRYSSSR